MRNLVALLLTLLLASPALAGDAPAAPSATSYAFDTEVGPYAVTSVATVPLRDEKRARDVPVKVWAPRLDLADGVDGRPSLVGARLPVIVFSHGAGGSREGYAYVASFWASHGYVVVLPQHEGSDSAILGDGGAIESLAGIAKAANDPANWEARPRDIAFVLDSLGKIEAASGLAGRLDRERIGMGGHSFGAYTALATAGARVDLPGRPDADLSDARPRAFLAMSPQGPGRIGLDDRSYEGIARPFMCMTGSKDKLLGGEDADHRRLAFTLMPPGDKYLAWLDGAEHMTFGGGRKNKPADPLLVTLVKGTSLAFWDAYLRGNEGAKKLIGGGELSRKAKGTLTLAQK